MLTYHTFLDLRRLLRFSVPQNWLRKVFTSVIVPPFDIWYQNCYVSTRTVTRYRSSRRHSLTFLMKHRSSVTVHLAQAALVPILMTTFVPNGSVYSCLPEIEPDGLDFHTLRLFWAEQTFSWNAEYVTSWAAFLDPHGLLQAGLGCFSCGTKTANFQTTSTWWGGSEPQEVILIHSWWDVRTFKWIRL